jgi:Flp pilus assembly protein TadD
MKKVNVSILASLVVVGLLLSSCGGLNKMVKMASQVQYEITPKVLEMHGDSVEVTVKVTFPPKYFQKQAILEIIPVLKYEGGEKAFKSLTLQGESVQANNQKVTYINGGTYTVSSKILFEEGMRKADLFAQIKATMKGKTQELPEQKVANGVMATALLLEKDPMPIAASDKYVRVTTDSKGASIFFVINDATVRGPELKKEEIIALQNFVAEASANQRIEFKGVEISAYASPDGPEDLNTKLSANRLKNAESYFERELKKSKVAGLENPSFVAGQSTAEDWEGFKKIMQESDIQDKELILRVLSMYSDPVVREKEIKNIAAAYDDIKLKVLPQLRRSKLSVNIAKIGYSDDELKAFVASNIDTLNLEELLYTATLFGEYSAKLPIYQKAAAKYADDWRAINNVGYVSIKLGKVAEAKAAFEQAKALDATNTTVLNNLGVIAYLEGDSKTAEEFYNAAAGAGGEVSYNMAIIYTKKGNYEKALNLYASSQMSTFNFALTKMLNYSLTKNTDAFDASLGILSKIENQNDPKIYYLKAILGARKQDSEGLFNNLRIAVEKDAALAAYAKKDIEFAQYANDATFKGIIQ